MPLNNGAREGGEYMCPGIEDMVLSCPGNLFFTDSQELEPVPGCQGFGPGHKVLSFSFLVFSFTNSLTFQESPGPVISFLCYDKGCLGLEVGGLGLPQLRAINQGQGLPFIYLIPQPGIYIYCPTGDPGTNLGKPILVKGYLSRELQFFSQGF